MAISKKDQALRTVFFKYLITVAGGLFLALLFSILSFNAFYISGLIVPANFTENQILQNKSAISEAREFDEALIPENASYIFLSFDGDIIAHNMSEEIKEKALAFHKREIISRASSSFIEINRPDGYVIINYSLEAYYANAWFEEHFPKIDRLYISLFLLFSFINVLIITFAWAKRLSRQLSPILEASEKIAEQELDFSIGKSDIREFNTVLSSLDKMKKALSNSLRENWLQEENKRSRMSALTHDLKTPIAIVKGNAELLKDTKLSEEQNLYVDFILRNTERISEYSKALMQVNKTNQLISLKLKKVQVSVIADRTVETAVEVTSLHKIKLSKTLNYSDKIVMIDLQQFERVLQNIFTNALQFSPEGSTIDLKLFTDDENLEISVSDQGPGFSDEDLAYATQEFYRGDKSRHSGKNYGLGLYTSAQIMNLHNGKIKLQNKPDGKGAKVTLKLSLVK